MLLHHGRAGVILPQISVGQRRGLTIIQYCKSSPEKHFLESIFWVCGKVIYQNGFADDFLLEHLIMGYGRINH